MPRENPSERRSRRLASMVVIFAVGVLCGLLMDRLPSGAPTRRDYMIHGSREGLTSPLLDCEIAGYVPGRELRPFEAALRNLVQGLQREGRAAHISVYFRDLDNGPWFGIDENRGYIPASLLKVPVVMAAMKQAERDPGLLRREARFEGFPENPLLARYPVADPLVAGRTYTVEDLMLRSAAASDNYATALLVQNVDPEVRRRLLDDLGLPQELDGGSRYPPEISPKDYGRLFRVLYNATYLTHESSERLLGYFARSAYHDGLEAGLPLGTTVAHKFGAYTFEHGAEAAAQLHDCGIVYAPSRAYFLCVMTQGQDHALLAGVIAKISRFVYDEIDQQALGAAHREWPFLGP